MRKEKYQPMYPEQDGQQELHDTRRRLEGLMDHQRRVKERDAGTSHGRDVEQTHGGTSIEGRCPYELGIWKGFD